MLEHVARLYTVLKEKRSAHYIIGHVTFNQHIMCCMYVYCTVETPVINKCSASEFTAEYVDCCMFEPIAITRNSSIVLETII